eukprot:SAG31_NODE_2354_length_5881_cov_7.980111_2_plen_59_part_00
MPWGARAPRALTGAVQQQVLIVLNLELSRFRYELVLNLVLLYYFLTGTTAVYLNLESS